MEARDGISTALRRVSASVRSLAGNDTPDVVQEAVARALQSGVSLEAEQWLRTVARRVAIDQARKRRERPVGAPVELESSIRYHDGDPAEMVLRAERAAEVREALEALPSRYRRVLEAYLEDDSPGAVARSMGMSVGAAWTLLSRARSRLKLELEQSTLLPAAAVGGGSGRFRELVAAGIAAAVAATASLVPSFEPPAVETSPPPPPTVVESEVVTSDPEQTTAPLVEVPQGAQELVDPVKAAVEGAAGSAPKAVEIGDCPEDKAELMLGAELTVETEFESDLLSGLAGLVPDELHHIKLCL